MREIKTERRGRKLIYVNASDEMTKEWENEHEKEKTQYDRKDGGQETVANKYRRKCE